jgi:hypothetical protein
MSLKACRVGNFDTPKYQGPSCNQAMCVVSETDPKQSVSFFDRMNSIHGILLYNRASFKTFQFGQGQARGIFNHRKTLSILMINHAMA